MRHALLYGEFELTIDDKNRLLIPSEIRKGLDPERDGEALFLQEGVRPQPWLYPAKYYENVVSQVPSELMPVDDMVAFDQLSFALASRLEWDKQGRVLMPLKTLKRCGIGSEVTLIGARDHLELWNRAEWEQHREQLLSRRAEIVLRARQVRTAPAMAPGAV